MSLKKTNLHIGLVVKLICCFRGIIARRIVRRRIGVGVESLAGHSRRIKRRRIFPVVPVIGGVLLLWLLIRLESIRVVEVGLSDLLQTVGGGNPSGVRWRRRRGLKVCVNDERQGKMIGYYMHQWVYESVTKKFNVCMYGVLLLNF